MSPPKVKSQDAYQAFIQAARQLIVHQGYEHVTVRKVAEITGYTFPAVYHYFNDLEHLLTLTKVQMIHEAVETISYDIVQNGYELDLRNTFKSYIRYYVQYPNIFRFFNVHILDSKYRDLLEKNSPDFNALYTASLASWVDSGKIQPRDISNFAITIIYAIHGMIILNLSTHRELHGDQLLKQFDQIFDLITR